MNSQITDFIKPKENNKCLNDAGLYVNSIMRKITGITMLCSTFAIAGGDIKAVEPMVEVPVVEESSWQHSISIYGWLPSLDGTLKYTIPGDDNDESAESDLLDKIDMVFMTSYEARKDNWSFLADMIYLKMSDGQDIYFPNLDQTLSSDQELTGWLVSLYGGYNIYNTDKASLDVIAGMRYFSLDLDVSLTLNNNSVSVSPSIELYDAVLGFRGAYNINENWFIPYAFDIGGGDSDLTWQALTSLGYRFDWGDVLLTYRYIHYDKSDGLVEDFDLYGPKLGVVFHF